MSTRPSRHSRSTLPKLVASLTDAAAAISVAAKLMGDKLDKIETDLLALFDLLGGHTNDPVHR
jgi:hypothetical protein